MSLISIEHRFRLNLKMKKIALYCLLFLFVSNAIVAQELNALVTINSNKIEISKQLLQSLEKDLSVLINERNWTNSQFAPNERIDCRFSIIITEAITPTSFKGELQVQSRRPIYNSTYTTPMLNYRDAKLSFDYIEHQQLGFDLNNLDNNLTSIIAYYVYLILGLDFDSMSPLGGNPFYQTMYSIAANAQTIHQSEWGTFTSARSRASIAAEYNNPQCDDYRLMWYAYHRKGLDEMATNIDTGRENIVTSLSVISSLKLIRPNSMLINMFGDAKLDELIDVYSNADVTEKKLAIDAIQQIYPAKSGQLDTLRK